MNRELIVKLTECKPCTAIGKNLKSVSPAKFNHHMPCAELGTHSMGSKEKAKSPNVTNFLDEYIENHYA